MFVWRPPAAADVPVVADDDADVGDEEAAGVVNGGAEDFDDELQAAKADAANITAAISGSLTSDCGRRDPLSALSMKVSP